MYATLLAQPRTWVRSSRPVVPSALPLPTPASSARNVPVRRAAPRRRMGPHKHCVACGGVPPSPRRWQAGAARRRGQPRPVRPRLTRACAPCTAAAEHRMQPTLLAQPPTWARFVVVVRCRQLYRFRRCASSAADATVRRHIILLPMLQWVCLAIPYRREY
jgi:hypothetical protein